MTIYNIFDYAQEHCEFDNNYPREKERTHDNYIKNPESRKDAFLSAFFARLFFLCFLVIDAVWMVYSLITMPIKLCLCILTLFQIKPLNTSLKKSLLSLKRSVVCFLALLIAIISPGLGVMFSCMYFLMYDKKGVEEIVPTSLKTHFKEIIPNAPFA